MGKLEYFAIQLQKPVNEAIYFPGEQLIGALTFKALERFKINSIYMIIDGTCRVEWNENTGRDTRTYSARETYIYEKIFFINENRVIDPGKYSFSFSFTLPLNLPTSFEHKIGRIRYSLNGTIDLPWANHKHTNIVFTILNDLDLNMLPSNLRRPSEKSGQKTFCCGPCKSNPVTGEIIINKTGFVPGEVIKCNSTINNNSSYLLKPTKIALIQQIDFHGDGFTHKNHIKKERREVVSVQYNRLTEEQTTQEWDDIRLLIPPVCSSTTEYNSYSNLIQISYEVVLFIRAATECSACHFNKELAIPVVIGTRPLIEPINTNFSIDLRNMPTNDIQFVSPPPYSYQASFFATDTSEDLPPDYDEAVGNSKLVQSNSSTFRPFYPYFGGLSSNNL